jgi:ribosomal protein L21
MNVKDGYSYIELNGEKYTFQRVILLNDLKHNPFYKELVKEYNVFNRWLNSKKGKKYIIF